MSEILIYCPQESNRLSYILDELFTRQIGVNYRLETEIENFRNADQAKINYSNQIIEDCIQILPHPILFEENIRVQELEIADWEQTPVFFSNSNPKIPFDIFAASFYLLSRYEEYLPAERDQFDRYLAKNSVLYRMNALQKPVIDIWLSKFKNIIQDQYPDFGFPERIYTHIPTVDIDNAYAFLHRGFKRNFLSIIKRIILFQFKDLFVQIRVLLKKQSDPFDTHITLDDLHKKYQMKAVYFYLVGDYSKNDTNIPFQNKELQQLIKTQKESSEIGIHPSTSAYLNKDVRNLEKQRLAHIIDSKVLYSRNHFLLLKIPESFETSEELEITDDYSLGYSETPGFRAGISSAFRFYNLNKEEQSTLTIHPFAFMDATFIYYTNKSPQESLAVMKTIIDEVKAVNGTLMSLWHNESLSNFQHYKDWQNIYEAMLAYSYE